MTTATAENSRRKKERIGVSVSNEQSVLPPTSFAQSTFASPAQAVPSVSPAQTTSNVMVVTDFAASNGQMTKPPKEFADESSSSMSGEAVTLDHHHHPVRYST